MTDVRKPERVADLLEKEIPPVLSWIGEGVLAKRNLMVLAGAPKIGKSFYSLEFARALVSGTNVFGHPQMYTERCRVLYVEQEIGELQLQKRIRSVFAKENRDEFRDRFWYISQCPELKLDTPKGKQILFTAIEESQANIVILDPAKNLHSYDENSNTEIAQLFATLHSIKASFIHNDLSIILNHHMKKPPQNDGKNHFDPLDPNNCRGASNWYADPDSMMTVHRNRELNLGYEAWETTNRVILRNDGGIQDFRMSVNRENDMRVRFDSVKGGVLPLKKEPEKPLPGTLKGTQEKLGFQGE